ncbi:uncharacterized protein, partial [Asterias amurensis]|uniref:uncharacterized protein n=1 Tax=Asterias amurensis TaxID=7602 RepID=UPI003AB3993A
LLSGFERERQSRNLGPPHPPIAAILGAKIAAAGTPSADTVALSEDNFPPDDCLQPHQVRLGKKVVSRKPSELVVGKMVATHLEEYSNEWPQVGEVTSIDGDSVELRWFTGTYTSKWTQIKVRAPGKKGSDSFKATICRSNIIGEPFDLTRCKKLPSEVLRCLKSKYEEIYE